MSSPPAPGVLAPARVSAAGAVLWRGAGRRLRVALVHRPRYDDWSWPKGKLDGRETWPAAAVREVHEETSLRIRLGRPIVPAHYSFGADGTYRPKTVHYWAARAVADDGPLRHEIDEVVWLSVADAERRLTYPRDRRQLRAVVAADRAGHLRTWPVVLVRHARSVARRTWDGEDPLRPLTPAGASQAERLVPLLAAFGVQRVLSSDSERCVATMAPFAEHVGQPVRPRPGLSEEGFAADPARAGNVLAQVLRRGVPSAICSHRPVLPSLLARLACQAGSPPRRRALSDSSGPGLVKGEALVVHLVGRGEAARVVGVERHIVR